MIGPWPLTARICARCNSEFMGKGRAKWCSERCRKNVQMSRCEISRAGDDVRDVFWKRVDKTDGCWLWRGALTSYGYGMFYCVGRSPRHAHRVAYEISVGPIPRDLTIDHLCMNKLCVNPAHLEAVTGPENTHRFYRQMTHCKRGHEFTPENTYSFVREDGYKRRACRMCRRLRLSAGPAA